MSFPVTGSPDMPRRRNEPVTSADVLRRQRRGRSVAIALSLAALAVLFYLITIAKFGPSTLDKLLEGANLGLLDTITLSYTFYPAEPAGSATVPAKTTRSDVGA
jgi:hypothetical protein